MKAIHIQTLVLFLVSIISPCLIGTCIALNGNETDRMALLSIKSQLVDHSTGILSSWNDSFHHCDWQGIKCDPQSKRVTGLDLSSRNLSGTISPFIANMTFLSQLLLYNNSLHGQIPYELTRLSSLVYLYLNDNSLDGHIPSNLSSFVNLQYLALSSNKLSGIIPPSIYDLSSLQILDLYDNQLEGILPQDIGFKLPRLTSLSIENNLLSGSVPISISNLTNLQILQLQGNRFTSGPSTNLDFRRLHMLHCLDLSDSNLGGELSSFIDTLVNCRPLEHLSLMRNRFTGVLPKSLFHHSTLGVLLLAENQLSGEIPASISNLTNLQTLYLDANNFTGTIPHQIGMLQKMEHLYLNSNKLTGYIPESIANLSRLTNLNLSENHLQGTIPPVLGTCTSLLYLYLDHNNLNGTLPNHLFGGSAKFVEVVLSHNHIEGSLPMEISEQTSLTALDVSQNKLSGEIPNAIGACITLQHLNIEGNSFSGSIPPSFSHLGSLQTLELSRNNLSGPIPDYLKNLPLMILGLSYNNLEGKVPTSGVFANASAVSFIGNAKLCGGIAKLGLPRCMENRRRMPRTIILIVAIVSALGCVAMAVWLFLICHKNKRKCVNPGSSKSETFLQVSYNMLLKATDGFSSKNLLGTGAFGSVFKGVLEPYGMTVAVKVLNLQCEGASKSFMAECEALRNIRHRNLVKIVTACSSIDFQGNEFKALVYEFMSNGSVERWLHQVGNLSLVQRVEIAIDVACALDYLHNSCEIPMVHGDLKPSNILLDHDMLARVADFGQAKFLSQHQSSNQSSTIGIRGTVGYTPPEYGLGGKASRDGDVYSFGILVIELMTGKRPDDKMFEEDFNLHKHAKEALADQVLHIVDPILVHSNSDVENQVPNQVTLQQRQECMVLMVQIGVSCSNMLPTDRMKITDAITQLRRARDVISNAY